MQRETALRVIGGVSVVLICPGPDDTVAHLQNKLFALEPDLIVGLASMEEAAMSTAGQLGCDPLFPLDLLQSDPCFVERISLRQHRLTRGSDEERLRPHIETLLITIANAIYDALLNPRDAVVIVADRLVVLALTAAIVDGRQAELLQRVMLDDGDGFLVIRGRLTDIIAESATA